MSRSPGQPNRSLFVRFVSSETRQVGLLNIFITCVNFILYLSTDDLEHLFSKYGIVKDVYIPRDYYSGKSRGFAYVEFEQVRDAENAIHNAGRIKLFGQHLEIEYAQGDRKSIIKASI